MSADLPQFLIAFGLVPLLLVSVAMGSPAGPAQPGEVRAANVPPWWFALAPTWTAVQLAVIALAGAILGWTASRPAQGLAAVGLGVLLGLAADLWWFTGFVRSDDQSFVTMLPKAEWQTRMTVSALCLLGAVSAGFALAAVVRSLIRHPARPIRSTRSELVAVGVAVVGGPILALAIASAATSSALVVPDGAQVQRLRVSAGAITTDPLVLRPGTTRVRCDFGLDAFPGWAYLIPLPAGVDVGAASTAVSEYLSACGPEPGKVTWGGVADLQPGRYVWMQIDNRTEVLRKVATSPVVVVAP